MRSRVADQEAEGLAAGLGRREADRCRRGGRRRRRAAWSSNCTRRARGSRPTGAGQAETSRVASSMRGSPPKVLAGAFGQRLRSPLGTLQSANEPPWPAAAGSGAGRSRTRRSDLPRAASRLGGVAFAERRAVDRLVAVGHPRRREPVEDRARIAWPVELLDPRRPWNASSVTSSPKNPSTPSRMISARPPTRRAMTGVPQASASIATSPNGSGHEPGISDGVRLGEQRVALGLLDARRGTRRATRRPSSAGWKTSSL